MTAPALVASLKDDSTFSIQVKHFNHFMKKSPSAKTTAPQSPIFPKAIHQLRPVSETDENSKSKKRPNTFSKSRDTREDRGARQMKTSHSSQTLPHAR
jgi:hypothetical protein